MPPMCIAIRTLSATAMSKYVSLISFGRERPRLGMASGYASFHDGHPRAREGAREDARGHSSKREETTLRGCDREGSASKRQKASESVGGLGVLPRRA